MHRRPELWITLAAVALFAGLAAGSGDVWSATVEVPDTPLYQRYGEAMAEGQVPYRDLRIEYPPGALPAFLVPALLADGSLWYARVFAGLMVAAGIAAIVLTALLLVRVGATPGRLAAVLGVLALVPLLLPGVALTRFDLYPAAVLAAALASLLAGRERLAAGLLGAAAAIKLYPLVLLPLVLAWAWRRRGRREAAIVLGLVAAVVAAAYLPFVLIAPEGVLDSVGRQLSRPLQIESLGAGVLLALHQLGMPLEWESSKGSQNLTGIPAGALAVTLTIAQLAVLGWLWTRFARGPATQERFLRHAAACLLAFVALGKVLSPQFLLWLLPVVPLVAGARGAVAASFVVLACLLTRGWFPGRYWELVKEFDARSSWLVLARDVALVLALAALVVPAARLRAIRRAAPGSPSPSPSPDRT